MTGELLKNTLAKLGATLKDFRQHLGISQEELAHRSGLHRTYITEVERGARNVTMDSISKLARALSVPLSELFARVEGTQVEFRRSIPGIKSRTIARQTWPVNILLVEDNPKHAELTLNALEKNGVMNNVLVVTNGEEALEYLQGRHKTTGTASATQPEVVLLDLILPNMQGVDVLRKIRADHKTRDIPVVVLTSSRSDQDFKECMKLGVTAYINKPVDFLEFSTLMPTLGFHWLLLDR